MSAIPTHPSNRKVIEQMVLWGWEVGKVTGRSVEMVGAPLGATNGIKLSVKPATQHDANPQAVFKEIYRLTTNSDAEAFWAGPPDVDFWREAVRQARQREKQRKDAEHEEALRKAAERARAFAEREERERKEAAEAEARKEAERAARRAESEKEKQVATAQFNHPQFKTHGRSTILSRDVFQVFVNDERPLNYKTIAERMHVDIEDPKVRGDLAARCSYLFQRGYLERMMDGVYRITPQGRAINARVQHDVGHQPEPVKAPEPAKAKPDNSVKVVTESIDDTIEAVLDLLLPNGFRGSDMRYIAPWLDVTREMIEQVTQR